MHNGKRKRMGKPGTVGEDATQRRAGALGGPYDAAMVEHVRLVTSLFEGRKVSRQEVLAMLEREEKRQQGIGGGAQTAYRARDRTENSS